MVSVVVAPEEIATADALPDQAEQIKSFKREDTGRLPPAQDASVGSPCGDGVDAQHRIARFWIGLGGISQNHLIRA